MHRLTLARAALCAGLCAGLVSSPALADELTFAKLGSDPTPYRGKVVRFSVEWTRIQERVNPLLASRGIDSDDYFQVQTIGRKGGSMGLLVRRKNTRAVAALRRFEARQKVWLTGEVERLSANNGAVYYFVDIASAVAAAPEKPAKQGRDKPELTGGSKKKYLELDPKTLQTDPQRYHGKAVQLPTAPYIATMRQVSPQLLALAGLTKAKPGDVVGIRVGRGIALVPKTAKAAFAAVKALKPLRDRVVLRGTLKVGQQGRRTQAVLVVDELHRAPARK